MSGAKKRIYIADVAVQAGVQFEQAAAALRARGDLAGDDPRLVAAEAASHRHCFRSAEEFVAFLTEALKLAETGTVSWFGRSDAIALRARNVFPCGAPNRRGKCRADLEQ